ncbi:Alpha/Beta hydrolase protein [Lasiosphaeria hispida]|uniref:Alpha/Beta hydrolase protein n=1 Tax=Lasiosphaeria hispida TaxID=260671 RepID=A0AAJ0H547_9PEZI|nr:Alpha/Beta hydrolase protein [Lasiosphaeria hispida]
MAPKDLDCKVITPQEGAGHTHTVIFLHGRGSSAARFLHDLMAITTDSRGRSFQDHFPSVRWVFPQSEFRPSARFPKAMVPQWFDTWNIADLSQREELQTQGLKESVASVRVIVEREAGLLGGRWDRVVLAGVSQGGATAAHALFNLAVPENEDGAPRRLGGMMTFCSRMPFPGRSLAETRVVLELENVPADDEVIRNTPVLWQHCVDDPLVGIEYGRELKDALLSFGAQLEWKEYPEGGHWIQTPDGIEDAVVWFKDKVLQVADAGRLI